MFDVKHKGNCYHGVNRFQGNYYVLDESRDREEYIDCYCIGVDIPEGKTEPLIFTMTVRGYDNELNQNPRRNNDKFPCYKKPAVFKTEYDCRLFMETLNFPDKPLKCIKITKGIAYHKTFNGGAYFVKKSAIVPPPPEPIEIPGFYIQ